MTGTDLPPPYHSLKEDASTEENATEVTIPDNHDTPRIYGNLFEDKDIRIGFIQKVLVIKLLQTFAMTTVFVIFASEPYPIYNMMRDYGYSRINVRVLASLVLLGMLVAIIYYDKAQFTRPFNYMILVSYPLSVAFFTSAVSWRWAFLEIFTSWLFFNLVMFALLVYSILALHSKVEFKTSIGLCIAAGVLIVAYLMTVSFIYQGPFLSAFGVLYCSLAMFALTAYMLCDLHTMTSRTYRIQLSPSDFVKAALIMHIDYLYMIWKLFQKE